MDGLFQERFDQAELVGEGGMGSVYRVEDPRLARQVAVKVHRDSEEQESSAVKRFVREAQTTGRLEHPGIPPVYEMGETVDGTPYFALKWLEGTTLESLIGQLREGDKAFHERYDFPARYQIALKLCEALSYAHNEGIIHRDIKPENVILGKFGEVWLVDWGVAGPATDSPDEESTRLTTEPSFMGTLSYAAPEQLAGSYSTASDQYSLGALLYELFSLHPAHPGETRMEVLVAVTNSQPKPAERYFDSRQGRVPREVSLMLTKMLNKDPKQRFFDISEVTEELKKISGGDISVVCPHTLTKRTLTRFIRFLDNHHYWFMPLLLLWLLYPVYALSTWLSHLYFSSI